MNVYCNPDVLCLNAAWHSAGAEGSRTKSQKAKDEVTWSWMLEINYDETCKYVARVRADFIFVAAKKNLHFLKV
jgi:hypothetical protein